MLWENDNTSDSDSVDWCWRLLHYCINLYDYEEGEIESVRENAREWREWERETNYSAIKTYLYRHFCRSCLCYQITINSVEEQVCVTVLMKHYCIARMFRYWIYLNITLLYLLNCTGHVFGLYLYTIFRELSTSPYSISGVLLCRCYFSQIRGHAFVMLDRELNVQLQVLPLVAFGK